MTRSELCTILTAGMATIASSVLGIYVIFFYYRFPLIAGHLISASLMSAPAAIIMSKILYPEDGKPVTLNIDIGKQKSGSANGVKLCVGIGALLLSVLGFLALINWAFGWAGRAFFDISDLSLQRILSYLFYPIYFIIGIPFNDVPAVSRLLGERLIVTELVAYKDLATLIETGVLTNLRSITITTYALCGFSHVASLAIFVGGIAALAPSRARDLGELGFRALLAATLACLMTASIAGIFCTTGGFLTR